MEEMGDIIESRVSMGRGKVVLRDFNARVGEALGDDGGVEELEGKELVEWVEARDLRIVNGAHMVSGRWTWTVEEHRSVIDYIMIGGVLGEDDMMEMRVEDREGIDVPSDHKLISAIGGDGAILEGEGWVE